MFSLFCLPLEFCLSLSQTLSLPHLLLALTSAVRGEEAATAIENNIFRFLCEVFSAHSSKEIRFLSFFFFIFLSCVYDAILGIFIRHSIVLFVKASDNFFSDNFHEYF